MHIDMYMYMYMLYMYMCSSYLGHARTRDRGVWTRTRDPVTGSVSRLVWPPHVSRSRRPSVVLTCKEYLRQVGATWQAGGIHNTTWRICHERNALTGTHSALCPPSERECLACLPWRTLVLYAKALLS